MIGSDEDQRRVIAAGVTALLRLCATGLRETPPEPSDDGIVLYSPEQVQ